MTNYRKPQPNLYSARQLLQQAERLFWRGETLPAAVVCRAALETHLQYACMAACRRGETSEARNASCWEYAKRLVQAGQLDRRTALWIRDIADVGSRSAHNCLVWDYHIGGMIMAVRVIVRDVV